MLYVFFTLCMLFSECLFVYITQKDVDSLYINMKGNQV